MRFLLDYKKIAEKIKKYIHLESFSTHYPPFRAGSDKFSVKHTLRHGPPYHSRPTSHNHFYLNFYPTASDQRFTSANQDLSSKKTLFNDKFFKVILEVILPPCPNP